MADVLLERLAPHMIVGLSGTSLTDSERSILSSTPPAGIIIFSRNVQNASQLRGLASEILDVVTRSSGMPPLIAADHEGGRISVLSRAIGVPPTQMAIGKAIDLCAPAFLENARRILSCGINMVLTPVADINSEYLNPVIGVRSFGEDTDGVASFVHETVKALREAGILTCLKHFPGHGATSADSHITLPVVCRTIQQLREKDLVPFASGIEAGADAVMTGHIASMDSMRPASLDPGIVSTILRGEMGFGGVVMTDAMEMAGAWAGEAAVVGYGEPGRVGGKQLLEVMRTALTAGNDVLLFSGPVGELFQNLESSLVQLDGGDDFWYGGFDTVSSEALPRIAELRRAAGRLDKEKADSMISGAVEFTGEDETTDRTEDEVYRAVADRAVKISRDFASLLSGDRTGRKDFRFCGERDDFRNGAVRRFITRIISGVGGDLGESGEEGEYVNGLPAPDDLETSCRFSSPVAGDEMEIVEFTPGTGSEGDLSVVFLLNRRPLSRRAVSHLSSDADVVVVAEWPYAEHFVDPGKPVIVTYGTYDASAEAICGILGY